ncbi:MAG: hydroxymethylbilane synthase [Ilyomonas sp.]
MNKVLKIGTRDSQLAVWQASLVQKLLKEKGFESELIYIKSDGDIDLVTPLYAIGVQGVFTRALDAALLSKRIDIAVHSMKDVPTQLAKGIQQAAVLPRASYKDIFVYKDESIIEELKLTEEEISSPSGDVGYVIATSSIRRQAQWLNRYPGCSIANLRGNVNTRLRKLEENDWQGAIFAAAGLERISLRPEQSVELDWMLPAPAQGAIMVVCNEDDTFSFDACKLLNNEATALCAKIERDFLSTLMGGCSTPIGALAVVNNDEVKFKGNLLSIDGSEKMYTEKKLLVKDAAGLGVEAANEILQNGGKQLAEAIRNVAK